MDETVYKRSPKGKKIVHGSETKQLRLRFHNQSVEMKRVVRIGRDEKNDIVLADDPLVSRRHAVIEFKDGLYRITDLGSTNQTYLNNRPLPPRTSVVVSISDIIMIGHTKLHLSRI